MTLPPAPPPVVAVAPAAQKPEAAIIDWRGGIVRCGMKSVPPVRLDLPFPLPVPYGAGAEMELSRPTTIVFDIDARGRPVNIRADDGTDSDAVLDRWSSFDGEASLSASLFQPNAPQTNCRLTYAGTVTDVSKASDQLIAALLASPNAALAQTVLRRRIMNFAGDCYRTPLQPRTVTYPDQKVVTPRQGGYFPYAYRFDIDGEGKTTNIRPILEHLDGDISDRELRRALAATTFAPDARKNCMFFTGSVAEPLPAPPRPDDRTFRPKRATCPFPTSRMLRISAVPFPEPFRKRNVLGWAVIRFDVAQWGEIGNASIVEAQPARAFGRQALALVKAAAPESAIHGKSGCTAFIRYEVDDDWRKAGVSGGSGSFVPDDGSGGDDEN